MPAGMAVPALTTMKEGATVSSLFKTKQQQNPYLIRPCPGNIPSFLIALQLNGNPSGLLEHFIQLLEWLFSRKAYEALWE